ncbi:MAG: efflux RND transporter periplasmic adaptor subunit [Pseudomonadales bacterium]|nr:efflux RND transporter periplasmic adaptor subunit [Pseudomonadales bacterium]
MTRHCRCALLGALLVLLGACDAGKDQPAASATAVPAVVRPVKTFVVDTAGGASQRQFPGRIDAARRAELSFRVPGTVTDILVREGDTVSEGAVLARLDATDFRIVLSDRQASYDNARRNYERTRELLPSGNISRIDYDRTEASFKSAEAALRQAQQDLAYTELKAPFAGSVAKRLVQRFEEVAAKEAVISLQQLNSLDVKIDLSETLVRTLTVPEQVAIESAGADAPAWATFEGKPEQRFPLKIKEVATKADPQTQTFEITFTMTNPKDVVILPGMTATVTVDFRHLVQESQDIWIPATAVLGDATLHPVAWVIDPGTMTVSRRELRVGEMQGERIHVIEGLAGGEEIVAVGASHMAEGMKVTRMASGEQAIPRAGDPR